MLSSCGAPIPARFSVASGDSVEKAGEEEEDLTKEWQVKQLPPSAGI